MIDVGNTVAVVVVGVGLVDTVGTLIALRFLMFGPNAVE